MKPPMPPIELDEEYSAEDLRRMPKDELMKVPFEKKLWKCCAKNCNKSRGSVILDFGIHPWYYFHGEFVDISRFVLFCSKHWRFKKHLEKSGFSYDHIYRRLRDFSKSNFQFVVAINKPSKK
jgi:hypothetical protein